MTTLASSNNDAFVPTDLYGGEAEIVTNAETIASGNTLAQYEVLGRVTASGELAPWNPGGADGTEVAVAIAAQAIDASGGAVTGPVYIGGFFNPDALVWPGGASAAQKAAAFDGSNIALRVPA